MGGVVERVSSVVVPRYDVHTVLPREVMMNRDTELSRFSDYRADHLLNSGMVLARCSIIT